MINTILLALSLLINLSNAQQIKFCQPVKPNVDSNSLPQLSKQFQTRIEMNILNQLKSQQVLMIYDYDDRRCEMIMSKQNKTTRTLYYFDRDELYTIEDNKNCKVTKLSQSNNLVFGSDLNNNFLYPKPPSFALHFNNEFPTIKLDDTTRRGIKVTRYQSCQDWPEMKANVLVDYYFRSNDFSSSISFSSNPYNELPVAAVIEGYANIDQASGTYIRIKHEYNYYEFRPFIERNADLYVLPNSIFCDGLINKQPIPSIPSSFSFHEQVLYNLNSFTGGSTLRFEYSYPLRATRQDIESARYLKPFEIDAPYKIINDFNSGVGYGYNKQLKTCTMFPLSSSAIDQAQMSSISSSHISVGDLKDPNELFQIDSSYNYIGQRYERGILCDVWVSKQNGSTTLFSKDDVLIELYMLNKRTSLESNDGTEQQVPISRQINNLRTGEKYALQFFDFDSTIRRSQFDLSDCFEGKDKIYFGIRFEFNADLDQATFDEKFGRLLNEPFYQALMKVIDGFEVSPLRIITPRIESNRIGFIVYSGFTGTAQSKYHFKRTDSVRIDVNKIKVKLETDSPDKCADICLQKNDMQKLAKDNKFICRSFDACRKSMDGPSSSNNVICSFYDNSTLTDPDLVLDNAPECFHHSKVSQYFDTAKISDLYRVVEESVIRKQFSIELKNKNGQRIISFDSKDFFEGLPETNQQQNRPSSYQDKFKFLNTELDFDEQQISLNNSAIIYKKTGVNLDECARLCYTEPSFECQSFSYSILTLDCKWSTLLFYGNATAGLAPFVTFNNFTNLFGRDVLSNYYEYPSLVTSVISYSTSVVYTKYECADKCNKETQINCRSFNFCNSKNPNEYYCTISETNTNSDEKNPNNVFFATCSHFSRKAINDFQPVSQTQLGIQPVSTIKNTTVETCAELCYADDSFFCRSFDFFMDLNQCNLYKENLKDKNLIDLKLTKNQLCTHYSRLNYEENGKLKQVVANTKNSVLYSGATIFGVICTLIIGGLLLGMFGVFGYFKFVNKKNVMLPVMEFINPNFNK